MFRTSFKATLHHINHNKNTWLFGVYIYIGDYTHLCGDCDKPLQGSPLKQLCMVFSTIHAWGFNPQLSFSYVLGAKVTFLLGEW